MKQTNSVGGVVIPLSIIAATLLTVEVATNFVVTPASGLGGYASPIIG